MVQGDFSTVTGPKPEGFSGGQFCRANKTLHNAALELKLGPKLIEQKLASIS